MKDFTNIHKDVLLITDAFFAAKVDGETTSDRVARMNLWAAGCAAAYKVDTPEVFVSNTAKRSFYRKANGDTRAALVLTGNGTNLALFRQFRKHLQAQGSAGTKKTKADSKGYAHSLFRAVRPDLYAWVTQVTA